MPVKPLSIMNSSNTSIHTPLVLELESLHGLSPISDERLFLFPIPKNGNPSFFRKQLQTRLKAGDPDAYFKSKKYLDIVRQMIISLGRLPSPIEVEGEVYRSRIFDQIKEDRQNPAYIETEDIPKKELAKKREEDFPEAKMSKKLFAEAPIKIDRLNGVERLILYVPNSRGELVEHPVMTNEEIEWVDLSARIIANVMSKKKNSEVFIAGLGLALLNHALVKYGVAPSRQIVAEINKSVIEKVCSKFEKELIRDFPRMNTKDKLQILEGDFMEIIDGLISSKKTFSAVSIDVFPNSSDEINKDSSNAKVLKKALQLLEPGGLLTFYADSRYLPYEIVKILNNNGIPNSSINYSVARIKKSDFTEQYHYGDLLSVVHIQKPLIKSMERVESLLVRYEDLLDELLTNNAEISVDKSID